MLDSRLSDTPTISDEKKSPANSQLAVSFVLHLALMLTLLGVSQWVLSTVFSPDTFFDFSNLFEINAAGRRQLLLIAFFPLALFLAWQAGHQWIGRRNLPVTWRAATMTIAAFVTFFAGMALPAYAQPYLALITGFAL
ncbi:MAG: hypothetical protein IT434_18840, partial [Phycisphaerales bacterium]|nr:hypothetical protein [Phycisphaerales bacterium]